MAKTPLDPEKALQEMRAYLSAKPQTRWLAAYLYRSGSVMEHDPKVPTASTNGKTIRFGDWALSLPLNQRAFVGAHELLHGALRHMQRARAYRKAGIGPDLKPYSDTRMKKAEDYHVNPLLLEMGFQPGDMPPGGLYHPAYTTDMSADEIYCQLPEEEDDDGDGPGGDGWDEHEEPEEDGDGEGEDDQPSPNPGQALQDQLANIDNDVKDELLKAQAIGQLSGGLARKLGDLLTPKVDWADQLKDWVNTIAQARDNPTYARVNRRRVYLSMKTGVPIPGREGFRLGTVVIAPDVSGSITETEYTQFMSEIGAILEEFPPEELHLIHWDTVAAHTEVEDEDDLERIDVHGGGGTVYTCVPRMIETLDLEPDLVICMTDGYVDWPTPEAIRWPHITLSTSDQKTPFGETIHVNPYN